MIAATDEQGVKSLKVTMIHKILKHYKCTVSDKTELKRDTLSILRSLSDLSQWESFKYVKKALAPIFWFSRYLK